MTRSRGTSTSPSAGHNILNWPGWTVLGQGRTADGKHFLVEARPPPAERPEVCPECGVTGGTIYLHGSTYPTYTHIPMQRRPGKLKVTLQRWKCQDCGGTFTLPLPEIDEDPCN